MIEEISLKRQLPPEWLSGNIPCNNPHLVTLHGAGGQGVAVPLALLVADSDLAREVLAMCEGPDKHISLVGVDMDTLKIYGKLLSSGEVRMIDGDRIIRDTVTKRLRCLLSIIGSKIVVESKVVEYRGLQSELLDKNRVDLTSTNINNNERDDVVKNSAQSAPLSISKPSGVSSSSLKTKEQSVCQSETTFMESGSDIDIEDLLKDMDTARDAESDPLNGEAILKKESPDDGYEALLAPAIIKAGYDAINDVEIIGFSSGSCNRPKTSTAPSSLSTSHNTPVYPCGKCKRVLGNKGAWKKHTLACQSKTKKEKRKGPQYFTCLDCQEKFSSWKYLHQHKNTGCKGSGEPPFQCNSCFKTFATKDNLSGHLRRFCPSKQRMISGVENDGIDDKYEDNYEDYHDGDHDDDENEDDEHLSSDNGDPEDTRDDHISCEECGHKLFTQENFERHQQQTGHTGQMIRLPRNITY